MGKRRFVIRRANSVLVIAACGILCAGAAARAGPIASFQGLGFDFANDVSDDGLAVVGNDASSSAFLWRQETGAVPLGSLGQISLGSIATSVSADGSVIAGYETYITDTFELITETYRWENGVLTGLGSLPAGGGSRAWGISGDGAVVVGGGYLLSAPGPAFRWTQQTGMVECCGGLYSVALDASADGSVMVGRLNSDPSTEQGEAFRWANGVTTGIGDLPGGSFSSLANAVSPDGSVIVGVGDSALGHEAFRWENGVMVGLGDLPGGNFISRALAVSADGSVAVGQACSSNLCQPANIFGDTAFIWDDTNGMRALEDVLINDFDLDLGGWTLERATGVSADGATIVGSGLNPTGGREGWIARIPEPCTFALLSLGALIMARGRRGR